MGIYKHLYNATLCPRPFHAMQSPISRPALGRIHHQSIQTPRAMRSKQDCGAQHHSCHATNNLPFNKHSATNTLLRVRAHRSSRWLHQSRRRRRQDHATIGRSRETWRSGRLRDSSDQRAGRENLASRHGRITRLAAGRVGRSRESAVVPAGRDACGDRGSCEKAVDVVGRDDFISRTGTEGLWRCFR